MLLIGKDVLDLRDEIYCQLVKQTTNNKSDNWESCKRGWMLLMICTAYFDCSQWLKPYLVRYFEVANDPKREFHGAASVCEQNLIKSFKHGGRKQFPSKSEMTMLLKGKYTKHERVVLPGNSSRLVKITTSSTTADAVKQICQEMGLETDEEFSEYSMFTYLEDQNLLLAAQGNDYIFDVFSQLEKQDIRFVLAFRKVIWYQTVKFSNPILVEVLYNQVLPDLLNGYLLHAKEPQIQKHMGMQSHDEIALLAALQHRINGSKTAPSLLETSSLIPVLCNNELSPNLWVTRVQDHFHSVIHLTAQVARKRFLEIISSWHYFGSSFYYVKNSSHVDVTGECILAVNRDGVHFLSSNSTETMVSFPFNEILSTRNLRTDTGRIYLDLKCGNLMVQKVTRMETPRGKEISTLIGQYIQRLSRERQQQEMLAGVTKSHELTTSSTSL